MKLVSAFLGLLLLVAPAYAQTASPDDTAKFLAGMPVPSGSPLAPLTTDASWKGHAGYFDGAFRRFDDRQRSKIQRWSKDNVTVARPTLFYMFSGPDFLHANSFFPDQTTYVLSGLEPVGAVPDIMKMPRPAVAAGTRTIERSLRSILNVNFFITNDMATELRASSLNGTLPILYVFLARSGKVISDVTPINLAENGDVRTDPKPAMAGAAQGVKITFSSPGGPAQTLYYFNTNVANGSFKKSGFEAFCERLGTGVALVKSASYLLHGGNFSEVRAFLMKNADAIVQDDTGIPARMFDAQWQLRPYGRYVGPIGLFAGNYQAKLTEIFNGKERQPLDFGLGYKWRPNESNLLLATKKAMPQGAASGTPASSTTPAVTAPPVTTSPALSTPAPK